MSAGAPLGPLTDGVLQLPDALEFSRGRHRICFTLPRDPDRCIKVPRQGRSLDQSVVEYDYHRYLARRGVPMDHIAACHGWADTSHGRGLIFDRIRTGGDARGDSLNLEAAILGGLIDGEEVDGGLAALRRYLLAHRILWSDENPKNICVQREPTFRLVIVDGLGGRRALNLQYRVLRGAPLLARAYTARKFSRLLERVEALKARASAP